ncbi:hypothetical protein [Xenorhabdus bovienii]|uniref:hypothetical protein n=1 Tax=Xenorhabdus bovienii TaxID=40576 RepID=UPI0023B2CA37|nr:hypothetical protein [Xenorhabdus bovienii]MDE9484247.1 hypothetical protein [Xenorhabdus bovienii]
MSVTKKEALVSVCNYTNQEVLSISVVHKYSSVYKNEHTFEKGLSHDFCSPSMTVDYNVGLGTYGSDWWMVTWVAEDGTTYISCPNEFSHIYDILIDNKDSIFNCLEAVVALAAVLDPEPATKIALAAAAVALTKAIAEPFINADEDKINGFKMHTLREEDAYSDGDRIPNNFIKIKVNEVIFNSPSGDSTTAVKSELSKALLGDYNKLT